MKKKISDVKHRLQLLLAYQGLTQKELADKAHIREASLSHYIQGKCKPSQASICKIADAVGVSPDWLMGYGADTCVSEVNSYFSTELINAYEKADTDIQNMICSLLDISPPDSTLITKEEIDLLFDNAGADLQFAIILATECGLTIGEISGLKKIDFDLDRHKVSVHGAMTFTSGGWGFKDAKVSIHDFNVPDFVFEYIKGIEHDYDYIITSSPSALKQAFGKLIKSQDMVYTWNDLRRYAFVNKNVANNTEALGFDPEDDFE